MKQVWQADDGTIFEKEIGCEKYENRLAYEVSLYTALREADYTEKQASEFTEALTELVEQRMESKLINFIKSIGEHDGN